MTRSILLFALAAAACAPVQPPQPPTVVPPPAPPAAAMPPPAPVLAPVTTLEGEWRVAGIDGQPLDEPYGIALSASDKEIWWSPRCAGFVRSYTISGTAFSNGPPLGYTPPRPGDPPPVVCLIAPPPKIGAVFDAIRAGRTIGRAANNGIEISGGGHSLLLFSQ